MITTKMTGGKWNFPPESKITYDLQMAPVKACQIGFDLEQLNDQMQKKPNSRALRVKFYILNN